MIEIEMDWFESEVRSLEGQLRRLPSGWSPLAFYGSSSIRLWSSLNQDFPGVDLVNLGFGGSTLGACVRFFDRIVVPVQPRALIVYAGDNDLGIGLSVEEIDRSLADLLAILDATLGPIPFGFISVKPSLARWHLDAEIRRLNGLARTKMETRPNGRFIDVYPRMLNPRGRPRRELYGLDGLHLSPAGYELWREVVTEQARDFLKP